MKNNSGFSFVELMTVVTILAILTTMALVFFNPIKQTQKAWDVKRKTQLNGLKINLEDFYGDKDRFPVATEICFDSPSAPRTDLFGKTACSCHICGNSSTSPSLSPYLSKLPCDPESSQKEYLYDYDCSTASPGWYRAYTRLSLEDNPVIISVGCGGGCGPSPAFAYNYLVYSNTLPETLVCYSYSPLWEKKNGSGSCNICKSIFGGDICDYTKNNVYTKSNCTQKCSP